MDEFRAAAQAVGQCLHLNHMTSADSLLSPRKVDSRSDYGWVKLGTSSAYTCVGLVLFHSVQSV